MFLVLFLSVIALYLFHELYWKRRNLPPGPIPLPIFGNLLSLNNPPPGTDAFTRWTKQYGDVFTFWMGSAPLVTINSYETLKNTFLRDADTYTNKKYQPLNDMIRGGDYGIMESNGELWRDHRRFILTTFRDFGLGKNLMQEKILLEVEDMFQKLDEKLGTETDVPHFMEVSLANVINQIMFGYRFDKDRMDEFRKVKKFIDAPVEVFSTFTAFLRMFVPSLSFLIIGDGFEKNVEEMKTLMYGFVNGQIEDHRRKIDYDSMESTDYVECYLKEQRKREKEGDKESFNDRQLANMCTDLWFAGLLTTTNTLTWAVAYQMNYDGVQAKIHEELDRVIGSDRIITTADKNYLPYMNAFINETQRCLNVVPLNLQHETTRDTTISGYFIPKGTGVIAQIGTVLTDENIFKNAEVFNPERFLENGKLKKVEELIPFSIGKRNCLGEGLARMELFLFIANFYHRYKVTPGSTGIPHLRKETVNVIHPRAFNIILEKRH